MDTENNKAIARRFIQVWAQGDMKLIDELASPTISVNYPIVPQGTKGREAFKKGLERFRSAFPDGELRVEEEIAEGDKVVLRWSMAGTNQGQLLNIPPTGKKAKWTGITIYQIADGKVVEERGEEDAVGLLRQLGVIPPPPAQ